MVDRQQTVGHGINVGLWICCLETTTHLINASSPRSLILTISLLWFNFRIARDSRASR